MRSDVAIEMVDLGRRFVRKTGRGIHRTRVSLEAVDTISLTVDRGEIVGWLGPNGAGKSTTIKMCTGILVPTRGTVRVVGLDPVRQRRELAARIGVVFGQRSQLWWDLPLTDSFELLHRIHRTSRLEYQRRVDELTELLELGPQLDVPVRQLSLGQRMRGELVAALLHGPELLFLDEPTIGLDVVSKHAMHQALLDLRSNHGVTIVLTTHDLGDVRKLCDRVTVIDHGRIALSTDLEGLLARAGSRRTLVVTFDELIDPQKPAFGVRGAEQLSFAGTQLTVGVDLSLTTIPLVLEELTRLGTIADLAVEERDIETVVRDLYRDTAAAAAGQVPAGPNTIGPNDGA